MKYILFLFFGFLSVMAEGQVQDLLPIPAGSGYIFVNIDEVASVQAVGANETRIFTTRRSYYTTSQTYGDFMDTYGRCRLLEVVTSGDTLAIPYKQVKRISYFNDSSGIVSLLGSRSFYRVSNMKPIKDSILYSKCGTGVGLDIDEYQIDSLSVRQVGAEEEEATVRTCISGTAANNVAKVNVTFLEPFEGVAPIPQQLQLTAVGGGCFEGTISFEGTIGDAIGFTYLVKIDLLAADDTPLGNQLESEVILE